MQKELRGQKALVTGAGQRIGRAIATSLGRAGCDVAVHYNSSATGAEEVVAEIRQNGSAAVALQADLSQPHSAEELAAKALEELNGIDILINNASVFPTAEKAVAESDLFRETVESWELSLNVNARAPFFLIKHLAPTLALSERGSIVNILDLSVSTPMVSRASHTVSKNALRSITELAAKTLAPKVRVNAVELGAILPPESTSDKKFAERNWGSTDDVVQAINYLLVAGHVNGETIRLDGGEMLHRGWQGYGVVSNDK